MPGNQEDDIFSIRDILDSQLEDSDKINIGRVADIEMQWRDDGAPVLTAIRIGPEALAGRVSPGLRGFVAHLLHGTMEHHIPLQEIKEFGPTLRLHNKAEKYGLGGSERWLARYILRWIPGSGYTHEDA